MSRSEDELCGRSDELSVLVRLLDQAAAGGQQFLVVSGEAGIGKSRLLGELERLAGADDWLVLSGRAAEFEGELPFGVVIDAFDAYLRTLGERDVDRLSLDRLGVLAAIFPALGDLAGATDHPLTATERFRVHRAVAELTERLAARQPVLIVLDDLQWADQGSLEIATHLVRRPLEATVMIAVGLRTGGAIERSRRIVDIRASDSVTELDLPPLDRRSVARLVQADDDGTIERVFRLSGGNPFFALQLARSNLQGAPGDFRDIDEVPRVVLGAIEERLSRLSDDARDVAIAGAVVGDPFELDLTVAASGLVEDRVLDGLDELCEHDVVRPGAFPRVFQFRHPLMRNAVYQAALPGQRIARHRRIAGYLAERGAPATEMARHLSHSARHGDLSAVGVLERAAREVLATAPESAVSWLTSALALVPGTDRPERRISLYGVMARAAAALGDFAGGLEALEASLAIVPDDRPDIRATLTMACAEGEGLLGHPQRADARLQRELRALGDRESRAGVTLCVALASNGILLNERAEMLRWAREAERIAVGLGDDRWIAAALAVETTGAAFAGEIEHALELQVQVSALLDSLSDDALVEQLEMLANFVGAEMYLDCYRSALLHAERGLSLARSSGQSHLLALLSPIAGTCAWMLGEVERSDSILDDAIDAARLVDSSPSLAWNLLNRALGALMGGDLDTALASSGESMELSDPFDEGTIRVYAGACRAQVLHEAGDAAGAVEVLLRRACGDALPLLFGGWRGVYFELLTRCHLALGDRDEAAAAADRATAVADAVPLGIAAMAADRAQALVALEDGASARAVDLARSAIDHAAGIESPVHVATSRGLLGRALAESGDVEAAIAQLLLAADGYDALDASRYRDQIEAMLRGLGQTIHRRSQRGDQHATGIATLTGRELEVAELITARHTNREIAEQLFLSLKTVETHVRNIFNKLDVSSRTDIARRLEEHRAAVAD